MEALQLVITSEELDLDELDPDLVNMLETWVPVNARENQINQLCRSRRPEPGDGLNDWEKSLGRANLSTIVDVFENSLVFSFTTLYKNYIDLIPNNS